MALAPQQSGTPQRSGWRGRLGQQAQLIRHRWQRDWNAQPMAHLQSRDMWQRIRLVGLLGLLVGLVGLLVFELWYRPVQTPLVAIVAPAYSWPLPPQAFAQEDLTGLADLDHVPDRVWERKGSIRLFLVSPAWHSNESGLADFDRQLHAAAQHGTAAGCVILYVSMLGTVDSAGRPALIPPGASPLRSETWLLLADLLEHIKSQHLPDGCHKLLILDCNRVASDWSLGVLSNGFANGLREAVRQAEIPNFVVLNSASSGQRAWASAELGGSVFGHYLRLGLAGAADSAAEGGNADRRVSLHELVHYLDRHVDGWAGHNRADRQQPLLLPASAADFTITWALHKADQETLAHTVAAVDPNISAAGLNKLWAAHDRLAQLQPLRFDPLAWNQFEQKLLWLEQAAAAGPGYRTAARAMLRQAQDFVAHVDQQVADAGPSASLFARADVFSEHGGKRPAPLNTHVLALAQLLGDADPQRLVDLRARLDRAQKSPTQPSIAATLADLPPGSRAGQFVEFYFLRLLDQELPGAVWQQPALVSRALIVSDHGDRAAVSDDERGEFWSLPLVATGNRARRSAIDQMLVGDDAALAASTPSWEGAERRYAQADALAKKVAEALALRDRVWGEAPYLARWLARPLPANAPAETVAALDAEINNSLLPLIQTAHALDATLTAGQPSDAASAEAPPFEQQVGELRAQLTHLEELFAKECGRLEGLKKGDALTQRQVDAVLALPLVPAEQRETLRRLSSQLAAQLNGTAAASAAANSKPSAGGESVPESAMYLERCLVRWQEHPALAIVADDEAESAVAQPAATKSNATKSKATASGKASDDLPAAMVDLERRLRERLEGLPGTLHRLRDAGTGDAEETPPSNRGDESARVQAARSRAERLARAAAGIGLPPLDDDPIRRLRQWDVQQLLLWHCRRVLDDFWGPAGGQEQPLFAVAAADYLRGTQAVGQPEPAVLAECNRLAKLLESRRQAATGGLRTAAADVLLVDENEPVQVKMAVEAGPEEALKGLPRGQATVFLRDSQGRIPGTSRSLELPLAAAAKGHVELDQMLPGSALVNRGPALDAVTLLRGNQFTSPLLLHAIGGLQVDFRPYHYGPPQVTLGGRSRRRASIVFILDCSNSMSEPTELEGPGGTQKLPRLEAARIALREMLSQLAEEGDARVGVMAYGHRVGWNLKKPSELLRQSEYNRPIPDDLRPSEDVEVLLPLGRFDQIVAGGVLDTLKSLKPWGETPLYLSLIQAIGEFDHDEPGTDKNIVVITDGVNYQFNSPSPKTHDDVMQALGDRKIAIDILGFAISDSEAAQAAKDFGTLATQTGGSYASVSDGTTLVRSLESLLGPKGYEVRDADGTVIGHAPVGAEITIRPKPISLQTYLVSLGSVGTSLQLAGGEAAELLLGGDGRSIHALGYDLEDPQFGPLLLGLPGSRTPWKMGVHRPVRDAGGVRFTFSVQRSDEQFSARPAEAWIEVTPKGDDRNATFPKYIFYDANYEPGTPAPVLKWLAEDWPAAARAAEVRGWFKTEATKPGWTVKIADVADRLPLAGTGATLAGFPGFTYQVRTRRSGNSGGYRVAVIERHGVDSAGVGSLKVELFPSPARVVHRFDWQNHLVTHTFYLDETDEQALGGYELRFTRREDVQRDALQLLEPIVRNVSDSADLIRPTP